MVEYCSFPFVDGDQESTELNFFLGYSLSDETMSLLARAKEGDALFVTPYYLSLLNIEHEGYDDATVRSYIMYSNELVDTYGALRRGKRKTWSSPMSRMRRAAIAGGT